MSILNKIFGNANEKYLKSLQPLIDKINSLESEFEIFDNEALKKKTTELKERFKNDKSLDDLLTEAFALVREAAKRNLDQRHFDVQLIGGIVLHQGKIAEMKTGEGKTLAATLPIYLNSLTEKGVHVITVNDYLAKRDAVWMGQIFHALGLSVSCIVHETAFVYDSTYLEENPKLQITNNKQIPNEERDKKRDTVGGFKIVESYLRPVSRKEAYSADITYGTNNEFGFDYLRDNMAYDLSQMSQREFHYAIVDEVDSILIDEARTPLIISAPDAESSKWYQDFARLMPKLDAATDYQIDEKMKAVTLTEIGINKIEKILEIDNIYEEKGIKYLHYLEQGLRARAMYKKDKDYVIKDGQIIIVDELTGRLMPGRRWSGGLHQAIEAKEGVAVQSESLTLASITFQNYFRMYKKLAGMTGTAATSAEEFDKVYKLETIIIPTNKKMIRKELPDGIYKTEDGKLKALVREIQERHQKKQPVLVGTISIEKNEYLGKLLEREGIPHQILNAKHHEKEGEIIAQAGKLGAVTIATNMAGRGVDIVLGGNPPDSEKAKKVIELGGLHIIGTERHEARRIDNQLRGRAGRQGDPGSSQFFISLEDDLMRIFGGDRIKSLMSMLKIPDDQPIEAGLISKALEDAQSKIEGMNFDLRKHVLDYDDVMNKHREIIYKKRKNVLKLVPIELKEKILDTIEQANFSKEDYEKKEKEIGSENMRQLEKLVSLRTIDMFWMNHLEEMEALKDSVKLRVYDQRDPLVEYKGEGHRMFQKLITTIESSVIQTIFKARPQTDQNQNETQSNMKHFNLIRKTPFFGHAQQLPEKNSNRERKEAGRNDPCPCGSSKKYKKCCGR